MRTVIVAAMLVASVASADGPPQTQGIKIGDGRLHVNLVGAIGYDSGAAYFANALAGDMIVRPSAGANFSLDTAQTIINFGASAAYLWYPGVSAPITRQLSHPEANVTLGTAFNKLGAIEFQLGDTLTYSDQTTNTVAGIGLLSFYNTAYLAVPIHPGGGAIEVTPKFHFDAEAFSSLVSNSPTPLPGCTAGAISCDPSQLYKMDYFNLGFGLSGKWKFLPKTAVVVDLNFDDRIYWNAQQQVGSMTANMSSNLPSLLFRGTAGLSGLITSRISALLLVGGAGDFGGTGDHDFIGQAEIAYLGSIITARGGFLRTLNPVPVFGTSTDNRAYLEFRSTFLGRVHLALIGGLDYLNYANVTPPPQRYDIILSGQAQVQVQIVSFFSAGLQYQVSYRYSNVAFAGINYVRHLPMLILTLSY
jgi:hypothetical protein